MSEENKQSEVNNEKTLDIIGETPTANEVPTTGETPKKNKMKMWIIISASVLGGLALIGLLTETTYQAQMSYEVEAVPAAPAKTFTQETAMSGTYVIGMSPSEYVTGEEVEFTTAKSGTYICGEDFPPGTYDIEAVSGSGNVISDNGNQNLNEIMGTSENDNFYINSYDNYTFVEGEVLEVSGVSVKLIPQTNDTMVIEPGEYDLVATRGGGNVISDNGEGNLNEIMGTDVTDDFYVQTYDNYTFVENEVLTVSGVSIELHGQSPAVEAQDAYEVTETMIYDASDETYTCKEDSEEVDCETLKNYDELLLDITTQMNS